MSKEIKSVEDLRKAYPDLVIEIEDEVFDRLCVPEDSRPRNRLLFEERQRIRRRARRLAGM